MEKSLYCQKTAGNGQQKGNLNDEYLNFQENLVKLIKNDKLYVGALSYLNKSSNIAINAPWGAGKTFFINHFKSYLDEDGIKCIVYNVWENDFYDDPLLPFAITIVQLLEDKDLSENSKNVITAALAFFKGLNLNISMPIGCVALNANISKGIDECINEWNKNPQERLNTILKSNKNKLVKVKDILSDSLKKLVGEKKVVIFIDELDRCKPTFAVQVLERIKHFLNITNITFIFTIDKPQLEKIINHHYGDIDANKYLQKFFDYEFKLPYQSSSFFIAIIQQYCNDAREVPLQEQNIDVLGSLVYKDDNFAKSTLLSCFNNITPRDIIRICRNINIISTKLPNDVITITEKGTSKQIDENIIEKFSGSRSLIVLVTILELCYSEVHKYILEKWDKNNDVMNKKTINYYIKNFFEDLSHKIDRNCSKIANEVKVDAILLIMSLYGIRCQIENDKLLEVFFNKIDKNISDMYKEGVEKKLARYSIIDYEECPIEHCKKIFRICFDSSNKKVNI